MRIHTIEGKKVIQGFIWVLICAILFYVVYRIFITSYLSPPSYVSMSAIPKEGKIPLHVYQRWLGESVPHMDKAKTFSKDHFSIFLLQWVTHLNFNNKTTLLDGVIPYISYVNQQQMKEISLVEVYPRLKSKKKNPQDSQEEIFDESIDFFKKEDSTTSLPSHLPLTITEENLKDMNFLLKNLYNIEGNMPLTINDFPTQTFLMKDLKLQPARLEEPKILIFHTHSQEAFKDSRPGKVEDTVVGLGQTLTDILRNQYGVGVIHDTGMYDVVNGREYRTNSYERAEKPILDLLKKHPSVEVVIDLHRDGVLDHVRLETNIQGKPTAKIMFVNGICKIASDGKMRSLDYLPNPYLEDNMAFSLQMQLKANELYPGLTRKIYIKPYRYSLHMKPKSLLIEVGAQTNTVEEAYNAMEPLAHILMAVLREEG